MPASRDIRDMNMRYETIVLDCNLNDDDDFYRFRLFLAVPPQPQASVLSPQSSSTALQSLTHCP